MSDPKNNVAHEELEKLNEEIKTGNQDEGVVEVGTWNIPVDFFARHYGFACEKNKILDNDPTRKDEVAAIAALKHMIDMTIERNHFPVEWAISERKREPRAAPVAPDTNAANKRAWEYPWITGLTTDNWTIVGVSPIGKKDKNGKTRNYMVLLETMNG